MNYCYSTHLHGLTTSSVVSTNKLYILYVVLHKTQRKCPVFADDGTGPDKMAHIMGPPDCCDNAAQIIQELLQSIRVREEGGQGVHTSHTHVEYLKNSHCSHASLELFTYKCIGAAMMPCLVEHATLNAFSEPLEHCKQLDSIT